MTDFEIAQLDMLLGKLVGDIGTRIVLIPRTAHDGVQIGTYDERGKQLKEVIAATLKEAIEKIK